MQEQDSAQSRDAIRLLYSVAEQLKMSLTAIRRQSELAILTGKNSSELDAIRVQSAAALNLVDGYLFGLRHLESQTELPLEPVSLSSVLAEVSPALKAYGQLYGTTVNVSIEGRFAPVMAHRAGVTSALLSLGYALIGGTPTEGKERSVSVVLHRTTAGLSAGIYGDITVPSEKEWTELQGRELRQPLKSLSNSGAGLFVAHSLMGSMDSCLEPVRYRRLQGFAAIFRPSNQLTLV